MYSEIRSCKKVAGQIFQTGIAGDGYNRMTRTKFACELTGSEHIHAAGGAGKIPSSRAKRRAMTRDSASSIARTSSQRDC